MSTEVTPVGRLADPAERHAPEKPPTTTPRRSFAKRVNLRMNLLRLALLVAFLLLWEYASGRWIREIMVSSPQRVAETLWEWLNDGTLLESSRVTFTAVVLAFSIGSIAGVTIGYITGWYRVLGDVVEPAITALYTMPRLALAPLFLLWFGLGLQFRVVFAAVLVGFLVYYSTHHGIREVSGELVKAFKVMGGTQLGLIRKVILPSTLVWIVAGLKTSIPYALVGVVTAEMLASDEGLGFLVITGANQFAAHVTFAAIAVLMCFGLVLDRLVHSGTKRLLRWKNTDGQVEHSSGL